ncbi:hypothetical protein CEXT_510521 [Caerostris extrusa]|uniref:Uncharacterized protein n=1 Tax=Caerostris extrusa TaxID=172846 RepID=A0AAV4SY37_CAEEX|nr:hypothetical protein CEXT_510521 [Caerostris extrusa]
MESYAESRIICKYYIISFNLILDVSRKVQIRRMMGCAHGKVMTEESFIKFIQSQKMEESLSTEILTRLKFDKSGIQNCKGHGFDNGVNIAGKYKGSKCTHFGN